MDDPPSANRLWLPLLTCNLGSAAAKHGIDTGTEMKMDLSLNRGPGLQHTQKEKTCRNGAKMF